MAQVSLRINGYVYTIGCQDGEEPHLIAMGEQIEERVARAKALGSQTGEGKLLIMAALFMADELHDMEIALHEARNGKPGTPDRAMNDRLARLAARAEEIAAGVERH